MTTTTDYNINIISVIFIIIIFTITIELTDLKMVVIVFPVLQVRTGQIQPIQLHVVEFKSRCVTLVVPRLCYDPVLTPRWLRTSSIVLCTQRRKAENSDGVCLTGFQLLHFGEMS